MGLFNVSTTTTVCNSSCMSSGAVAEVVPGFIIGCCNLIADNSRYLLVQEAKPSAWSRYNLPAGKPERGETLVQAAVREAKEETGLDVTVEHLVGIYQCPRT